MAKEIKGLSKVHKQLQAVGKLKVSLLKAAEIIMQDSRENAPMKTGNLKESHKVEETKEGAEVIVDASYAAAVEYGTWKMAAQPYLRPAIDKNKHLVAEVTAKEVEKEIEKIL